MHAWINDINCKAKQGWAKVQIKSKYFNCQKAKGNFH